MASSHDHGSFAATFNFLSEGKNLSQHERDIFNSIVDRLPDHELFSLLQERRRWSELTQRLEASPLMVRQIPETQPRQIRRQLHDLPRSRSNLHPAFEGLQFHRRENLSCHWMT